MKGLHFKATGDFKDRSIFAHIWLNRRVVSDGGHSSNCEFYGEIIHDHGAFIEFAMIDNYDVDAHRYIMKDCIAMIRIEDKER